MAPFTGGTYDHQSPIGPHRRIQPVTLVFGFNWEIEMLFDEDLQHVFRVAHGLHPNREIAFEVTREGIVKARQKLTVQNRRPPSHRQNKQRFSFRNALLSGVFAASEIWERDQDSRQPTKLPAYKPTNEDDFMRFIKNLVWHSMDRTSEWVGIAVGHFLFRYSLEQIAQLSEHFDRPNTPRTKKFLLQRFQDRFQWNLAGGVANPYLRQATIEEFHFVQEVLAEFAPWTTQHPHCCPPSQGLLESYLFPESEFTEAERIHALINSHCAGWARFVDEYNEHPFTAAENRLPDPRAKLRVPIYANGDSGLSPLQTEDPDRPSIQERFNPEPLTPIELASLKREVM